MTALELFRKHLRLFGDVNAEAGQAIYAESVVVEFPYAPVHHTAKIEGRAAVVGNLARVGNYFTGFTCKETYVHELSDERVIVEYTGEAVNNDTQDHYKQKYVAILTAKDGEIVHIREYYNPIKVLVTFGEITEPGVE